MSTSSPEERFYHRTFALGFLYNFLHGLMFSNNSLFPLYVEFSGGGPDTIGLFMGLFLFAAVLGRPIQGALIDHYGARWVMLLATACLGLPYVGYWLFLDQGLAAPVWVLRAIQGFGWGAHMSAFFTLVGQVAPANRRNEAIAKYGMAGMIGSAFGPYAGETVIVFLGWSWFFVLLFVVGVLAWSTAAAIEKPKTDVAAQTFSPASAWAVLKSSRFALASFFALCHAASLGAVVNYLSPVMTERGISSFTLFFTAYSASGVAIRLLGSHWGDRHGYAYVLVPGFLFYGSGLTLIQFSHNLPVLVIAGLICGTAHGLLFPIITTLGYVFAPADKRGTGVALITGMMDVGNGLSALILGWAAYLMNYEIVFILGPIPAFCAVVVTLATAGVLHRERARLAET